MEDSGMHRRLAAILTADVVGYSRLMSEDESGTLDRVRRLRQELIEPAVAAHEGHIVKFMGDGLLAEFGSAVEAVSCAVEIQRALAEPESESGAPPLQLRIGVNLGDVFAEGGDIHGDGVNVAARMKGLADPGGICIARTVFGQVRGRDDVAFEDLGEIEVENIPQPVHVLRVLLDPNAALRGAPASGEKSWHRQWQALALGVAAIAFLASAGLWLFARGPVIDPASPERMAFPLPDKPSLAILPFDNLSDDPSQQHFADGMTDDLITDLSKVAGLFVIARNSTFAYQGQATTIRQVAEDLGVRYVVEGSVRRTGDEVRVDAQLIDATTGGHVWAERFDGGVADIFGMQGNLVRQIVEALAVKLAPREVQQIVQGRTGNVEAWEAFQKGWELYLNFNAEDNAQAVPHLEKAIELDPEYRIAYAALSLVYYRAAEWAWAQQLTMSFLDSWALGQYYLDQAMLYPTSLAHVAAAMDHVWYGRADAAFNEALLAVVLDRNDPEAHLALAWAMITSGRPEDGIESVDTAVRLNPTHPPHYDLARAMAYFAMADFERAAEVLTAAAERNPGAIELAPPLAASYAYLGRREDARAALSPWKSGASQLELQTFPDIYRFPIRWVEEHGGVKDRLFDGLRIAVLPLDEDIPKLLGDLSNESFLVRMSATKKLGWFRDQAKDAVPQLIPALADEHDAVRKEAALTLGKIGPAANAAIPALEAVRQESVLGDLADEALKEIRGD
ncbi:MAG: adenylate/guanylate cyclase domain-containing protein [Alphaproteobacteria bacterium]